MLQCTGPEKQNATRPALARFTVTFFFAALLLNFFCILNSSPNIVPLILLALCCPLSFLAVGEQPRFTWYHALFLVFIGYLFLHKALLFPEQKIASFSRTAVLAFLAGIAAFQLLKDRNMAFMYLINLVLPFVVAGLLILVAFEYMPYERLFEQSARLSLRGHHPNLLGVILGIGLLAGLSFLLRKAPGNALPPLLATNGSGRTAALVCRAIQSKAFVLCGTLLSLVLLLLTLSKTALFSTAIVGGLFSAYVACKRWGLLRSAALCLLLTLCAVGAWHLAPIEQQRKELFYTMVLKNALTPWEFPTFVSRLPIWESGILAIQEKPLFGFGLKGFTEFHRNRVLADYDRLVSIYGKAMIDGDTLVINHVHNVYLLWFVETGSIGGILFCLLFFAPLIYCLRKRTLYGEMGLILAVYAIAFLFDSQIGLGSGRPFGTTITFMTLGYFSSILGQRDTADS